MVKSKPTPVITAAQAATPPGNSLPPAVIRWEVEKKIPLMLIVGLMGNLLATVWWVSNLNSNVKYIVERVVTIEARSKDNQQLIERFLKTESNLELITRLLDQMERRIERNEQFREREQSRDKKGELK